MEAILMNVQDQKLEADLKAANERIAKQDWLMSLARHLMSLVSQHRDELQQNIVYEKRRAEAAERKLATAKSEAATEAIAAVLIAIDRLAESQRKELNGNPLTDGRYQGIRKCSATIRQALTQIEQPQSTPIPDYREIGREMAANRDANLVHAANRGVKCSEQLEAAHKTLERIGAEAFAAIGHKPQQRLPEEAEK
jgi:hypothetical protein